MNNRSIVTFVLASGVFLVLFLASPSNNAYFKPATLKIGEGTTVKWYQLIIYLDNASPQNAIGDNFKILVYNSDNEPILTAKPNIDFNDEHQKISPPNGYQRIDVPLVASQ